MVTVEELFEGRTEVVSAKSTAEVPYLVRGAADEMEVKVAITANTPMFYAGLLRKSVELAEHITADTWKVNVRYERPEKGEEGTPPPENNFSFDTGGGTQHITQSLETKNKYGPSASEMLGGAIGFDGENVTGVDITVPVYNFSETHYFPYEVMTDALRQCLFRATGSVNDDAFRGFQPGEVLFLGASGSRQGEDPEDLWEVTFKFAASKNRTDIQVGEIGPIEKKGWEYMWVQYAPEVDEDVKVLIKKPVAVYVERVYPETSFALFEIGA
ncbi:MAG: hypothetical protein AABY80_04180 [Candidatus Deferrimicrobiota bacterium]